jgi:hypothetical protein
MFTIVSTAVQENSMHALMMQIPQEIGRCDKPREVPLVLFVSSLPLPLIFALAPAPKIFLVFILPFFPFVISRLAFCQNPTGSVICAHNASATGVEITSVDFALDLMFLCKTRFAKGTFTPAGEHR